MHNKDERGVSDVIGFVLVAGLLLASVALVSITAFTQLNDAREVQQRENVVRAYSILNTNIQDIADEEASRRTTEIKAGGGQVFMTDSTTITVRENGTALESSTYEPIVYQGRGGDRVIYSNGAVIRDVGTGSTMVEEPKWYRATQGTGSDTTLYISVIETTTGAGPVGVGGRGTVSMTATQQRTLVDDTGDIDEDTQIEIQGTATPDAWERYCASESYLSVASTSSNSVTCEVDDDSTEPVVKTTRMQILLDN